jgi:hypothetical protein
MITQSQIVSGRRRMKWRSATACRRTPHGNRREKNGMPSLRAAV